VVVGGGWGGAALLEAKVWPAAISFYGRAWWVRVGMGGVAMGVCLWEVGGGCGRAPSRAHATRHAHAQRGVHACVCVPVVCAPQALNQATHDAAQAALQADLAHVGLAEYFGTTDEYRRHAAAGLLFKVPHGALWRGMQGCECVWAGVCVCVGGGGVAQGMSLGVAL
jgi:hypothetical protein